MLANNWCRYDAILMTFITLHQSYIWNLLLQILIPQVWQHYKDHMIPGAIIIATQMKMRTYSKMVRRMEEVDGKEGEEVDGKEREEVDHRR